MTLKDIQGDVYALGYEKPLENSELFISALNQAVRIIYAEQKYKKTFKIRLRRADEASRKKSFKYSGESLTLPLVGRAYSIRISGMGSAIIDNGETTRTDEFNGDDVLLRGFIKGCGKVTFCGDYSYDVISVVTYSEIFSDKTADIPDGSGILSFDFSNLADFLSFCDVARDELGSAIPYAVLDGTRLSVRASSSLDVYVKYNMAPKKITLDDPYAEIEIPRADEAALTLLSASLLWRDDEPELAEHYYSLYRELRSEGKSAIGSTSAKYELCDGWV